MCLGRIISRSLLVLILASAVLFSSASPTLYDQPSALQIEASIATQYHLDFDHVRDKGPYLNTRSALLVNYENGQVLYNRNGDRVRSIASISKLMTAMVVLDLDPDLDCTEIITREDAYRSSTSRLARGTEWTLGDLLHAMLMNSDNRAARAVARATYGSKELFAAAMNDKARELGLDSTHFVEPSGLDARNVSTAAEVARMLHYARDYPLIAEITRKKTYTARALNRRNWRRRFINTNRLLWSPFQVEAGKTGYIRDADYCLATLVGNEAGERLTLVVLGVPGDRLRFREAQRLLRWGFRTI
jgi:D-alanyl-D-alanine endopeptidase (penicillin-binding protein 7)